MWIVGIYHYRQRGDDHTDEGDRTHNHDGILTTSVRNTLTDHGDSSITTYALRYDSLQAYYRGDLYYQRLHYLGVVC